MISPICLMVTSELRSAAVQQYGIWGCIARLGYIYGPAMTNTDNKVVAQFLRAAVRGHDLVLESPVPEHWLLWFLPDMPHMLPGPHYWQVEKYWKVRACKEEPTVMWRMP